MSFKQCLGLINTSLVTTVLVGLLTFADLAVAATTSLPDGLQIVDPIDANRLAANPHLFDNGIHHQAGTLTALTLTVSISVSEPGSAGLRKAETIAADRATNYFAAFSNSAQLTIPANGGQPEWFNARRGFGVDSSGAVRHMFRSSGEASKSEPSSFRHPHPDTSRF